MTPAASESQLDGDLGRFPVLECSLERSPARIYGMHLPTVRVDVPVLQTAGDQEYVRQVWTLLLGS